MFLLFLLFLLVLLLSLFMLLLLFVFLYHFYFPASGQAVVSGVAPSPARYVPSFLSRIGFSIPTARRLSSNVANSRFRAFRESICAQEKVPTNFTSMHSGGLELTKLTYNRDEDNQLRHRGDRLFIDVFFCLFCFLTMSDQKWTRLPFGLVSLTSEALLSAMTWLAVHKMR